MRRIRRQALNCRSSPFENSLFLADRQLSEIIIIVRNIEERAKIVVADLIRHEPIFIGRQLSVDILQCRVQRLMLLVEYI